MLVPYFSIVEVDSFNRDQFHSDPSVMVLDFGFIEYELLNPNAQHWFVGETWQIIFSLARIDQLMIWCWFFDFDIIIIGQNMLLSPKHCSGLNFYWSGRFPFPFISCNTSIRVTIHFGLENLWGEGGWEVGRGREGECTQLNITFCLPPHWFVP